MSCWTGMVRLSQSSLAWVACWASVRRTWPFPSATSNSPHAIKAEVELEPVVALLVAVEPVAAARPTLGLAWALALELAMAESLAVGPVVGGPAGRAAQV